MRPCIIMHQYCRPMPLKERNSFRLQNLVNVTLSIEVALHNNDICIPSAHNATPYHNTPISRSVSLNETIISKTYHSSSKNSNYTVMTSKVRQRNEPVRSRVCNPRCTGSTAICHPSCLLETLVQPNYCVSVTTERSTDVGDIVATSKDR